ncbi:MAG: hypothetical protein D6820_11755 [Lentisphaerae bacterium]|nr:MAG: hypothetical protein D6820_11755 [Lentisphaerota bacterium]
MNIVLRRDLDMGVSVEPPEFQTVSFRKLEHEVRKNPAKVWDAVEQFLAHYEYLGRYVWRTGVSRHVLCELERMPRWVKAYLDEHPMVHYRVPSDMIHRPSFASDMLRPEARAVYRGVESEGLIDV